MPVLDTSFIVDLLRGREEALQKLAEMEAQEIPLSTTEINVLELYRGAYLSRKTHKNLEEIKKLLECFQVLELEESVYEVFASLSANLLSKGRTIGAFDELIASIILCHDGKIVTRDNHFTKVTGLEVIVY
ncbi:twitching motility protein PilT [Methanosarcina sp. 2.H.T.1A.6]|uniref:type II toxin-antitoxin system VapC family toxin n=1 Tax=unclassified Methanosarcina TaxID=2644672 RepID=UPI000620EFDB|nr:MULTISPECIES: type II toxin-antitoxin system VapC family toxin [unclassified Methanosarcina]KKG18604.1 twitching motility protein PilT [Methanosarcina sp. 2.H.T.1A.3]KKG20085.1 twitching motility protein PilT [Methanosarcina sp. 2.H.T.1A.15]KKG21194.1 twitching motility protein PilT [Methanosarcina sp. 2.H.T.1A.8]KKG22292.1 twitching motility protein PilT [Methanosarcina sp. 2.H.T.1A.6]